MTRGGARSPAAAGLAAAAVAVVAGLGACGDRRPPAGPGAGGAGPGDAADAAPDEVALDELRTAAIERAMNDLAQVAPQCWAAAAVDDYRLAGEVALLVEVGGDGAVTAAVHRDTTGDAVLTGCLRAVAEAYAWAPPMRGHATVLPFRFTAPAGQFVIDRRLVPDVDPAGGGARVLLDAANSGNRAASVFELVIPAGQTAAPTASDRDEVWVFLDEPGAASVPRAGRLEAVHLPPRAARAPAAPADRPLRILVVATPGGDEAGTRRAAVLPASPADVRDRKRPSPAAGGVAGAFTAPRPGVGVVTILVEPSRAPGATLAVTRLDIEAGAAIPLHTHDGATELLYVVSGSGTMTVDGVELPIAATSVVQIPPAVEHAFTAAEAMVAIQIYTPPGPEQRFKR